MKFIFIDFHWKNINNFRFTGGFEVYEDEEILKYMIEYWNNQNKEVEYDTSLDVVNSIAKFPFLMENGAQIKGKYSSCYINNFNINKNKCNKKTKCMYKDKGTCTIKEFVIITEKNIQYNCDIMTSPKTLILMFLYGTTKSKLQNNKEIINKLAEVGGIDFLRCSYTLGNVIPELRGCIQFRASGNMDQWDIAMWYIYKYYSLEEKDNEGKIEIIKKLSTRKTCQINVRNWLDGFENWKNFIMKNHLQPFLVGYERDKAINSGKLNGKYLIKISENEPIIFFDKRIVNNEKIANLPKQNDIASWQSFFSKCKMSIENRTELLEVYASNI